MRKKIDSKKENRLRSSSLLVRLTPDEDEKIRKAAKKENQPISWWVRKVLLDAV